MPSAAQTHDSSASRRSFLKTSAGVLSATSITSLATPVHAGADETIKIALVGCGNRGAGAAANALQTKQPVKLWTMADAFPDRLSQSLNALKRANSTTHEGTLEERIDVPPERQFGGLHAYKQAIDAADVAILCGPPGFRPEHFEYAVERGKHVFMEKPVATDAPGIRRVLAASKIAEQKGLKVGVGLQRHHEPKYLETIARLRDGAIGELRMLRCYWNGGTIKNPVSHEGLTELEYQVRNWYFFSWLSGDHNVEQHVHNLDVCNWIVGATPISAAGMGGRQMRVGKDYGDIFDHHAVEYTYPGGLKMFSYCRQIPGCEPLVAEFAVGSRGDAEVSKGQIRTGSDEWRFPQPRLTQARGKAQNSAPQSPYQLEHDALFAAILNNTPCNEVQSGANATMTAILGRMATYTGRTVTWDEGFQSEKTLMPAKIVDWNTTPLTLPDVNGSYRLPAPGLIMDV